MKIRVLEILASLKRAGAERMVVSLASSLDPERFETQVISLYDAYPGGFEPVLAEKGIPVRHLGKRRGLDLRMYPRLTRALRDWQPDIIHTHSYLLRYTFPTGLLSARARMVHTVHNVALHETDAVGRAIHKVAYRCGVQAVAVGDEVARSFVDYYGYAPAATIANGIDTEAFERPGAGSAWRQKEGIADDAGLVVSVARLEPQKNPLGLLDAFVIGLAQRPEWRLLMVGEGSMRAEVEQAIAAKGLRDRVHLMGSRPDIPDILAASDVFAMSSDWEGTPMAVIEAMAAGLPIISTAVGGVPQLVRHESCGLLVPVGDMAALGAALATLADSPAERFRLAAAARLRAQDFSLRTMTASYAELFTRLVGERQ